MNRFQSPWQRGLGHAGWLLVGTIILGGVAGMAQFGADRPGAAKPASPVKPPSSTANPFQPQAKKKRSAEEWRRLYPFESLTARLEYETRRKKSAATPPPAPKLSAEAAKQLEETDKARAERLDWDNIRAESLKKLHSSEVETFIQREGFGLERMPSPSLHYLNLPPAPPIPFTASGAHYRTPETEPRVALTRDEARAVADPTGTKSPVPSLRQLNSFHVQGQYEFLSPQSFGYAKDRNHVAGFLPHQFRAMPQFDDPGTPAAKAPKAKWAIARLELVSLLKHDKPAVYISEELPRMEQLTKARTRPLDEFEADALKRLQQGEDVVAEASLNHLRMMGSLRASKQCLQCHSVARGELLGSFSYDLQRVPPRMPAK